MCCAKRGICCKYCLGRDRSPRVPRPASSPPPARWRAFVLPSFRPPCIHEAHFRHRAASVLSCILHFVRMWICYVRCLRYRLPPSKHSPPSPAGHGRGLASRPGCAVPGEGIDSARRRLHRFRRGGSPRPSRFRLRLLSSMPGERALPNVPAHFFGVNRPGFVPSPILITPLLFATQTKCKEKQAPPEIPGSGRC